MYGYVVNRRDEESISPCNFQFGRVVKAGYVLAQKEEGKSSSSKNSGIASIANQGFVYYQVNANGDACDSCLYHSQAIYPVVEAKEGDILPPFHPNCKCIVRGFSTKNPNHDPALGETIFWLDIMYGDGTIMQKAQKVLDFYRWTENY